MPERVVELRIIDLLRSLLDAEVTFLVFGAVAAGLHGHVRATRDLDIIIDPAADNIDRVIAWLHQLHARLGNNPDQPLRTRDERALHMGSNAFVVTDLGRVDVVQQISGLAPWAELRERSDELELEGLTVRVVDRLTLIERKRARASPQDLLDIEALEAISARSNPGP